MANIYDKSSLVLIPSGTKTGKVFSQKPVSGDGDFTFTRASAATRVNADGNIEKETQNLLTYSNDFSNSDWAKYLLSLTSGQSGYDGTNNAWLIEKSGAYGNVYRNLSNSGVFTWSVYAKAGSFDFLALRYRNTSNQYRSAFFNLSNGTLGGADSNLIAHSIEDVGGGWYRCFMVLNDPAINQVMIYPSDVNNGIGNTGTGSIYIQDAQLEQGLVARDVITTTTSAVYGGITDNVPRLDYTDSSCPALLLEPQRTNRVTNSEYLNGTWSENRSTLIVNDDTSPEGVDNATKLQEDTTASNTHFTGKGYNYVSGTTYSWSVYAKADGRDEIAIQQGNPNVISFNARFNLTSETAFNFGNGTARIEDAGNGWYRCIIEGTTALLSSGTNINVFLRSGDSTTYTGDGTSGVLFYGFQLEEGSYATSYIPTYGSSVTRIKDDIDTTFSSPIPTTGNVSYFIHLDGSDRSGNATGSHAAIRFQGNDYITYNATGGGNHRIRVNVNGNSNYYSANVAKSQEAKVLAVINGDYIKIFVNGQQQNQGTLSDMPDMLSATSYTGSTNDNLGPLPINQIMLFPTALTDQEAIDLTTI